MTSVLEITPRPADPDGTGDGPRGHRREPERIGARPARGSALVALIPAALALALCLRGLGSRSMWNNEYATWHAVTLSLADFEALLRRTDLVHIVYYLFMRGWIAILGDSPFALRLPSAIAMALCAAFVALIGRRLISTPVGLFAGVLFALVPAVSRYGQESRSYALVTMAGAFATLMLLRALEKPSRSRLILYGFGVALMGLIHFVSLTLLSAHFVLWLMTTRTDVDRRWRVAGAVGFGMLGVIWLPAVASHQSASISWIKADAAAVKSFPSDMFLSGPVAIALGVMALLGALYLTFSQTARNRPAAAMLATWAVVPPVFCYVTFSFLHLFLPRYVLVVIPAWALLAAAGAYLSGRLVWRFLGPLTALVVVAAVGWVALPAQAMVRESPVRGQPDYRAAIMTIHQRYAPGDGVVYNDVFGVLSDLAREALDYEMRDQVKPRDVFLDKTAAQRASFSASECADPKPCLKNEPRIWLIYSGWSPDVFSGMPPARAELLKLNYTTSKTLNFSGVKLVLLVRRPAATL
jgi:mannosyltransferase